MIDLFATYQEIISSVPNILFFSSFGINSFLTVLATYYTLRITLLPTTPRFTWSLELIASSIMVSQIVFSATILWDIAQFANTLPPKMLIISFVQGATRSFFHFVAVAAIYYMLLDEVKKMKQQQIKQSTL